MNMNAFSLLDLIELDHRPLVLLQSHLQDFVALLLFILKAVNIMSHTSRHHTGEPQLLKEKFVLMSPVQLEKGAGSEAPLQRWRRRGLIKMYV